jgi:hypothetical protein
MDADRDLGPGESPLVATGTVVISAVAIFVLLIAIAFGLELLFPDRVGKTFVDRHEFPAPAVIANEKGRRLALEAEQNRALRGTGGRMPIEAAMRTIADRGPRAFDPVDTPP